MAPFNRGGLVGPVGGGRRGGGGAGLAAPRLAAGRARRGGDAPGAGSGGERGTGCLATWDLDNVAVTPESASGLAGLVGGLAAGLGGAAGYTLRGFGNRNTLSAPVWGPGVLDAALDRCEGDWCEEDWKSSSHQAGTLTEGGDPATQGGAARLVIEYGLGIVRVNNAKQRADVHMESEADEWLREEGEGLHAESQRSLVVVSGDGGFERLLRRAKSRGVTTVSVQRPRDWNKRHLRLPAAGLADVADVLVVCDWGKAVERGSGNFPSPSASSGGAPASLQDLRGKVFDLLRKCREVRKADLAAAFEEEHGYALLGEKYGLRKRELREALQGVCLDGELARRQGTTSLPFKGGSVAVKPEYFYPDPQYDERALWSIPKDALRSLDGPAGGGFVAGVQCFSARADQIYGETLRSLKYPYECCF